MTEWFPIETAPKDGRRILIAGHYDCIRWTAIGAWAEGEFHSEPDKFSPLRFPTHWMPLPEPPETKKRP